MSYFNILTLDYKLIVDHLILKYLVLHYVNISVDIIFNIEYTKDIFDKKNHYSQSIEMYVEFEVTLFFFTS